MAEIGSKLDDSEIDDDDGEEKQEDHSHWQHLFLDVALLRELISRLLAFGASQAAAAALDHALSESSPVCDDIQLRYLQIQLLFATGQLLRSHDYMVTFLKRLGCAQFKQDSAVPETDLSAEAINQNTAAGAEEADLFSAPEPVSVSSWDFQPFFEIPPQEVQETTEEQQEAPASTQSKAPKPNGPNEPEGEEGTDPLAVDAPTPTSELERKVRAKVRQTVHTDLWQLSQEAKAQVLALAGQIYKGIFSNKTMTQLEEHRNAGVEAAECFRRAHSVSPSSSDAINAAGMYLALEDLSQATFYAKVTLLRTGQEMLQVKEADYTAEQAALHIFLPAFSRALAYLILLDRGKAELWFHRALQVISTIRKTGLYKTMLADSYDEVLRLRDKVHVPSSLERMFRSRIGRMVLFVSHPLDLAPAVVPKATTNLPTTNVEELDSSEDEEDVNSDIAGLKEAVGDANLTAEQLQWQTTKAERDSKDFAFLPISIFDEPSQEAERKFHTLQTCVKDSLEDELQGQLVSSGFCMLFSTADLIFAEMVLNRSAELHVVFPSDKEGYYSFCREAGLLDHVTNFQQRVENIIANSVVHYVATEQVPDRSLLLSLSRKLVSGLSLLHAEQHREAPLLMCVVDSQVWLNGGRRGKTCSAALRRAYEQRSSAGKRFAFSEYSRFQQMSTALRQAAAEMKSKNDTFCNEEGDKQTERESSYVQFLHNRQSTLSSAEDPTSTRFSVLAMEVNMAQFLSTITDEEDRLLYKYTSEYVHKSKAVVRLRAAVKTMVHFSQGTGLDSSAQGDGKEEGESETKITDDEQNTDSQQEENGAEEAEEDSFGDEYLRCAVYLDLQDLRSEAWGEESDKRGNQVGGWLNKNVNWDVEEEEVEKEEEGEEEPEVEEHIIKLQLAGNDEHNEGEDSEGGEDDEGGNECEKGDGVENGEEGGKIFEAGGQNTQSVSSNAVTAETSEPEKGQVVVEQANVEAISISSSPPPKPVPAVTAEPVIAHLTKVEPAEPTIAPDPVSGPESSLAKPFRFTRAAKKAKLTVLAMKHMKGMVSVQAKLDMTIHSLHSLVHSKTINTTKLEFVPVVQTVVFAGVKGRTHLSQLQTPLFASLFLVLVRQVLDQFDTEYFNTWADGLYVVFHSPVSAALFACKLNSAVSLFDWASVGLPQSIEVRVAVHTGPLYSGYDEVVGKLSYFGRQLQLAEQIQQLTLAGCVYCSWHTAAAIMNVDGATFHLDRVGSVQVQRFFETADASKDTDSDKGVQIKTEAQSQHGEKPVPFLPLSAKDLQDYNRLGLFTVRVKDRNQKHAILHRHHPKQ